MLIKTLVENTSVSSIYKAKHGICFYIETEAHKILFDVGQNGLFLDNARRMGVDISEIDIVIISHGHIDHAGALKLFLQKNKKAKIYIRENAFDRHFTKVLGFPINVGIDASFKQHPQVILTQKRCIINSQTMLFADIETKELCSKSNNALYAEIDGRECLDDFSHEQNLIISEGKKQILIAGCSHSGIINIKMKAEEIINGNLDFIVAGFHLYNPVSKKIESNALVEEIAARLNNNHTQYFTCHCTGKKAYATLKNVLGDKLSYLATGAILEI